MSDSTLKQRILIADDEEIIADTLALILSAIGFESKAVYSGAEAVEVAAQFRPDILITDVIMCEMNGVEAALAISSMLPKCKVILFSGHAATADLVSTANSKAHEFEILTKPVHPKVLMEHVKSLAPPR